MVSERKTVEIKGLPDFSPILGCRSPGDDFTHLGALIIQRTACGKPTGDMLLGRDVTVDCPECVAEIEYRSGNPQAAKRPLGVVTHK